MRNLGKGYRTLSINVAIMLTSLLAYFGIVVPPELMTEVTVGILALVNFGLRLDTNTAAGDKE